MDTITAHKPTLEELRVELQGRLAVEATLTHRIMGLAAACRMIGKEVTHRGLLTQEEHLTLVFRKADWQPGYDDIKLDDHPITRVVEALYTYAFQYRMPLGLDPERIGMELEHLELLLNRQNVDEAYILMSDGLLMGDASGCGFRGLLTLAQHARARQSLDSGEDLTIDQLALLADMEVRSVRTSLKLGPLTKEHHLVDNEDAVAWLAKRREFVPTEFPILTRTPGDHPDRITTLHDLGQYLNMRWHGLGKSHEAIAAELNWPPERVSYLKTIEAEPHLVDPADCEDLAKSLLVNPRWFTEQVMRLKYPKQVERLLEAQAATVASSAAPAPEVSADDAFAIAQAMGHDKVSTRLMVVLHDGSKLVPVRMKRRGSNEYTFRLGDGSFGSNTLEGGLEVKDEAEMIRLVVEEGHSVRMAGGRGGPKNLIKIEGRAVKAAYIDGKLRPSSRSQDAPAPE